MPDGNEKLKTLHSNLVKEGYDLPDYATFQKDMSDANKLKKLHENLSKEGYDIPKFEQFSIDMGVGSSKKKEPTTSTATSSVSGISQQKTTPTSELDGGIEVKDYNAAKKGVDAFFAFNKPTPAMKDNDWKASAQAMSNQQLIDAYVTYGTDSQYFKNRPQNPLNDEFKRRISNGQLKLNDKTIVTPQQLVNNKQFKEMSPMQQMQQGAVIPKIYDADKAKNLQQAFSMAIDESYKKQKMPKEPKPLVSSQKTIQTSDISQRGLSQKRLESENAATKGLGKEEFQAPKKWNALTEQQQEKALDEFVSISGEDKEKVFQGFEDGDYDYVNGKIVKLGGFFDMFGQSLRSTIEDVNLGLKMTAYENTKRQAYELEQHKKDKENSVEYMPEGFTGKLGEVTGGIAPYAVAGAIVPEIDIALMGVSSMGSNSAAIWANPNMTEQEKIDAINASKTGAFLSGAAMGMALQGSAKSALKPTVKNVYKDLYTLASTSSKDVAKAALAGGGSQLATNVFNVAAGVKQNVLDGVADATLNMAALDLGFKSFRVLPFAARTLQTAKETLLNKVYPDRVTKYKEAYNNSLANAATMPDKVYEAGIQDLEANPDQTAVAPVKQRLQYLRNIYDELGQQPELNEVHKTEILKKVSEKLDLQEQLRETKDETLRKSIEAKIESTEKSVVDMIMKPESIDKMLQEKEDARISALKKEPIPEEQKKYNTEQLTPTIVAPSGEEYSGANHGEAMEKAIAAGEKIPNPKTKEGEAWRAENGQFKDNIEGKNQLITREQAEQKYGITRSEDLIKVKESETTTTKPIEKTTTESTQQIPTKEEIGVVAKPIEVSETAKVEEKPITEQPKETIHNVEDWSKDVESTAKAFGDKTNEQLDNIISNEKYNLAGSTDYQRTKQEIFLKEKGLKNENLFEEDKRPEFLKTQDGRIKFQKEFNNWSDKLENKQKVLSELYHKAKADGSNPELVKAVEDLLGKPKEQTTLQEPIKTVTVGSEPPKVPPVEGKKEGVYSEQPPFTLIQAEANRVREQFGFDSIETERSISNVEAMKTASDKIAEWKEKGTYYKEIDKIIESINNDDISDLNQNILSIHIADLRETMSKTDRFSSEYDQLAKRLNQATDAGYRLRENAGRILGRQMPIKGKDISSVVDIEQNMMDDLNVEILTTEQKKQAQQKFDELNKIIEREKAARIKAEEALLKIKEEKAASEASKGVKKSKPKTKEEYKAERKQILQSIKDKWNEEGKKSSGAALSTIIPIPEKKLRQLAAIAPEVAKMIANYIGEGIEKLEDIRAALAKELKENGIDLSEREIRGLISGEFMPKKPTAAAINVQIKDLRQEEKYLLELDKLESGEEPKDEKKKIIKNQRLKELKDKIDELQKKNKWGKYSDEAKFQQTLKQRIAANKKQKAEFERKIAEKDFGKAELPQSITDSQELREKYPELYNEFIQSAVEKDNAAWDYEMERVKMQQKNMTTWEKVVFGKDVALETGQAAVAMFDQSVALVQLLINTYSHPIEFLKTAKFALTDTMWSQKTFDEFLQVYHNSALWSIAEKNGLAVYSPRSLQSDLKQFYDSQKNLLSKDVKVGKYNISPGQAFERATTTLIDVARWNLFLDGVNQLGKAEKLPETHPKDYEALCRAINELTGFGKVQQNVEKFLEGMNKTLGFRVIWSPKMIASTFNVLGLGDLVRPTATANAIAKGLGFKVKEYEGTKGFYASLTPETRTFVLKEVGRFIATGATIMAMAKLLFGDDVLLDLNPNSSGFGSIINKKSGKSYPVFGRVSRAVSVVVQTATGTKRWIDEKGETVQMDVTAQSPTMSSDFMRQGRLGIVYSAFIRGKETPLAGYVSDMLLNDQRNFYTYEKINTPKGAVKSLVIPISLQEVGDDIRKDGVIKGAAQTLYKFYGGNIRDQEDLKKIQERKKEYKSEKRQEKKNKRLVEKIDKPTLTIK